MELRPIQTALFAGRAASRWTSSTSSMPSLCRQFSTTRPFLAEGDAPAPVRSMAEWSKSFQQQRQQEQASGQQTRTATPPSTSNIYTFASRTSSSAATRSSSPSSTPTKPGNSSDLVDPWSRPNWTQPSNTRRSTTPRPRGSNDRNSVIEDLGLFNMLNRPVADDFAATHQHKKESVMDVKLRLRPGIGRTVHCGKGTSVDLARGLQLLGSHVRKNRVAQDLMRQRFHERPGLKKKRLRRERWRSRFKDGFKATCGRVRELARQGW